MAEIHVVAEIRWDIETFQNMMCATLSDFAVSSDQVNAGASQVADSAQALAQSATEQASSSQELISATIASVDRGTTMANRTGEVFREMERYAQEILEMIDKIAQASARQSESVAQISTGVDQITSVIQQNSAASEDLSSQADMIRQLVSQFKLMAHYPPELPAAPGLMAGGGFW